jgi:HAD superfamily hydrolase (TIGR01509 family)
VSAPVELVIFDSDGVLVDSERLAVKVDVVVLRELGWPLTEAEVVERFVGLSDREITAEIEAHLGRSLPASWEAGHRHLYREVFERELRPVDGVPEALERITIPTCVASGGSHEKLRLTLGLAGLYERFAGRIFSADEVEQGKPAPDLFLLAARRMGVAPAACIVVEDSRYGVQAARAANMLVLAYAGGLTPAVALEGPGTVVFDDMRDLPALIDMLTGSRSAPGGAG